MTCSDNDTRVSVRARNILLNVCVAFLCVWLVFIGSVVSAQDMTDFDGDGVPDYLDLDMDNDGISNAEEGYQRVTRQSLTHTSEYKYQSGSLQLSKESDVARYNLRSADDTGTWLQGTQVSGASVRWSEQHELIKVQNLEAGTVLVEWKLLRDDRPLRFDLDLAIGDIDALRSEAIIVDANSISGYSLPENSAVVVAELENRTLRFSTTSGTTLPQTVVLHIRDQHSVVIGYEHSHHASAAVSKRAGFRHSFPDTGSEQSYTAIANWRDTDADGLPDHRDRDSDNDGIADVVAAGYLTDVAEIASVEVDALGRPLFPVVDSTALATPVADDADADGLTDTQELHLGTDANRSDTDLDGFNDAEEVMVFHTDPNDSTSHPDDGSLHEALQDSDKDGITDFVETNADTDGDGIPNQFDLDSDNDGLSDVLESGLVDNDFNGLRDNQSLKPLSNKIHLPDTDTDGIPDMLDLDSDADGLFDRVESGAVDNDENGVDDEFTDTNSNGWGDSAENTEPALFDADSDEVPDHLDTDHPQVSAAMQNDAATLPDEHSLSTGVKGAGCALVNRGNDSSLLILLLFALCVAARRRPDAAHLNV